MPFREVGNLYLDDFLYMTEHLSAEDGRQQRPLAQLTRYVLSISGNRGYETSDLFTGYASTFKKPVSMPAHLHRALEVGAKLGKISNGAFVTLKGIRD